MKTKDIKSPSELPSSWLLLQTDVDEETALEVYKKKFNKLPKVLYRMKQGDGVLLYMNVS